MIKIVKTNDLETKASMLKTEINPDEIGKIISSTELLNYNSEKLKVIFFTPSQFLNAQEYLRNENITFLYVSSYYVGTVLVPNTAVVELKQRYKGTNVPFHTIPRGQLPDSITA